MRVALWPAARACLGSPAPISVSCQDVDLHPHKPDPPDQCGRGTDEASREALRNRLLQKQGRGLAELNEHIFLPFPLEVHLPSLEKKKETNLLKMFS